MKLEHKLLILTTIVLMLLTLWLMLHAIDNLDGRVDRLELNETP